MTSLSSLCRNGAGRPSGTFGRRKAMAGPNQQATSVAQNSNPVFNVDGILIVLSVSSTVHIQQLSILVLPYNVTEQHYQLKGLTGKKVS